jgi:hypothetical protein
VFIVSGLKTYLETGRPIAGPPDGTTEPVETTAAG